MIPVIQYPGRADWEKLSARPVTTAAKLDKPVRKILEAVRKKGDKALRKYTRKLDGVTINHPALSEPEIAAAAARVPEELKAAMQEAKKNIETFHLTQHENLPAIETMPGIRCWRKSVPIEKVGLYIPGGTAPLFSSVLMLAVPAKLAGCREIILCSPPDRNGDIHPAIVYAADLCGINRIYKAGGAQAIAAMAYGTETIPAVYKIFGPGNQYVTKAKQLVQQDGLAIDMPAGPSEVLVIADDTANPAFVAADLLSQAEHGADSQVILLSLSPVLAANVQKEISLQLEKLPRRNTALKALYNSKIIQLSSAEEALNFSNRYAPEHLILSCANAASMAGDVRNAGSVFIGNYSPESAGDYASGTNHTLPTNGYAAMYSGVSTDSFIKKITFQQLSREGLERISQTVMTMAAAEGLEAHKNAIAVRLNNPYGI